MEYCSSSLTTTRYSSVLLDLREGKTDASHLLEAGDPVDLFAQYLEFIRRMVEYVDRMEDHK